jgi:hypothetical protein
MPTDTTRPRTPPPVARIQIVSPAGAVVRELTGPATPGTHRVLWDLRAAMPFLPAPSDSGYYGTYRGPFVLPGRYTVKLAVSGKELTQPLDVRADPRAATTPTALADRHAMSMRIAELSGIYSTGAKALSAVDAELGRIAASVTAMPNAPAGADSVVANAARRVNELKPRFSPSYGTPIGRAFDLLGALQSNSGAPTEASRRILAEATTDLRDAITKLNEIITTVMPAVRTRASAPGSVTAPVPVP